MTSEQHQLFDNIQKTFNEALDKQQTNMEKSIPQEVFGWYKNASVVSLIIFVLCYLGLYINQLNTGQTCTIDTYLHTIIFIAAIPLFLMVACTVFALVMVLVISCIVGIVWVIGRFWPKKKETTKAAPKNPSKLQIQVAKASEKWVEFKQKPKVKSAWSLAVDGAEILFIVAFCLILLISVIGTGYFLIAEVWPFLVRVLTTNIC